MIIRATRSEDLSISPDQCDTNEQGESFQYGDLSYPYILQILIRNKKAVSNAELLIRNNFSLTGKDLDD